MSTGLFEIGKSGLISYQQALSVSGSNIANVYTEGYNRQTAVLVNNGFSGVSVSSINRAFQENLAQDLRTSISGFNKSSAYYNYAIQLDEFLGDDNSSIMGGLDDYFSSLQSISNDPSSITARQVFLNDTQGLINRFHTISSKIDSQISEINYHLSSSVEEVNVIAERIAKLNSVITESGTKDLAMLDQRDQLMKELSNYISFNSFDRKDGSVDIYLESGDTLVMGGRPSKLSCIQSSVDGRYKDIAIESMNGMVPIQDNISSGMIGGLLEYRSGVLSQAERSLDALALVIAENVNQQHQQGMDLNDQLGKLFFNDINSSDATTSRVYSNSNNAGTGSFSVTIDDATQLTASNYQLAFTNATDYTLTRLSDNQIVSSGTISSYPEAISVDGFTLNVNSGTFNLNDKFVVSPTLSAAKNLDLMISDPAEVALAMPARVSSDGQNIGNGIATLTQITDINNPSFSTGNQLSPPVRIEFIDASNYQIVNDATSAVIEGPIAYDPNSDIFPTPGGFDPGYQVKIANSPAAGDSFVIDYNHGANADNRNALAMASLQKMQILNNGTNTVYDKYQAITGSVSSETHYADLSQQSNQALMDHAQERRDSYSGVNMDEEAANLMRYQQAYQASAQIIAIADNILDTLINMIS